MVLPSKRTFQNTLFPIGSLSLHFAPMLTDCSLSVSRGKGEPSHSDRPLECFRDCSSQSVCV